MLCSPPPVTRLANQVMATADPLDTAVNESSGKIMTTQKQYIGTPFLVHLRRNLGALPSSERLYKFRTAQYV